MADKQAKNDDITTPESLEKGSRIRRALGYLTYQGIIDDHKDLIGILETNKYTISKAVTGKHRYTDGFIRKLSDKFNFFNYDYLMNGDGELIVHMDNNNQHSLIEMYKNLYLLELVKNSKWGTDYKDLSDKLNTLNNESSVKDVKIAKLETENKLLKLKSRRQSGGSASEQTAKTA